MTGEANNAPNTPVDFEVERRDEIVGALGIISQGLVIPLYVLFWAADWIYAREHIWTFLFLRLSVIPVSVLSHKLAKRSDSVKVAQAFALLVTTWNAAAITAMIVIKGEADSVYYAGLNLVCLGGITFIPWQKRWLPVAIALMFLPYLAYSAFSVVIQSADWQAVTLNLFFMSSMAFISVVIGSFNGRYKKREYESRKTLSLELVHRNELVQRKTQESVHLRELSRQFSPQIVHAITNGGINLNQKVHRSNICTIFVDIVNSTERIVRIDKDAINMVISRFMDDTMRIMVKYDLTIDKFLGDGILAFANDPMQHPDYIERTIMAALEIRKTTQSAQAFYLEYWLQRFEIRIGIACGYANVGFYGKSDVFKTYTAIGPVINLASRLCSHAAPNTIVVSNEVKKFVDESGKFAFDDQGLLKLKGFETDLLRAFTVEECCELPMASAETGDDTCGSCGTIMHLDVNAKGFYIFRCRECENHASYQPQDGVSQRRLSA